MSINYLSQFLYGSLLQNPRITPLSGLLSLMANVLQTPSFFGMPNIPDQSPYGTPRFSGPESAPMFINPFAESPFALEAQFIAAIGRSQVLGSLRRPAFAEPPYGEPAAEMPTPGPANGPSGIMGLSSFKLMLPTGREGRPDMVQGQDLASYQSPYFRQENGAITFYSPVNGATSANSDTTRSELGETQGWKIGSGPHSLSATLSVDQAPSNGKVTVGQLHQRGGSGRPPIMIHWNNGTVEASVLESNSPSAKRQNYVLAENVPKGQKFNYNINVATDGSVGLDVNGKTTNVKLDSSFKDSDMYFKAGVYLQDNQGGSEEGAKATFTGLQTGKGADKPTSEPQADKSEKPKKPAKK